MLYGMMINGVEDEWNAIERGRGGRRREKIGAWCAKWQAAGKMLDGGGELASVTGAKTIRPGADGKP